MTYIVLVVHRNGDRWWIDTKTEIAAKEYLKFHMLQAIGAVGTIIATENFDKNACIF
jgi:hypothetical protein